jgi:hypothetical protein
MMHLTEEADLDKILEKIDDVGLRTRLRERITNLVVLIAIFLLFLAGGFGVFSRLLLIEDHLVVVAHDRELFSLICTELETEDSYRTSFMQDEADWIGLSPSKALKDFHRRRYDTFVARAKHGQDLRNHCNELLARH